MKFKRKQTKKDKENMYTHTQRYKLFQIINMLHENGLKFPH